MTLKPYRLHPVRKEPRPETAARIPTAKEDIVLTGRVQGKPADSRDEELFAMALTYYHLKFGYQESFVAGRNMPGEIRPDFVVYAGQPTPTNIDNEQWHHTASQKADAASKDARLASYLGSGYHYPVRIPMPKEKVNEKDNSIVLTYMKSQVRKYFL